MIGTFLNLDLPDPSDTITIVAPSNVTTTYTVTLPAHCSEDWRVATPFGI